MEIATLGAEDAASLKDEVVDVYGSAWATTPYPVSLEQQRDFAAVLDLHVTRDDFRLVTARAGHDERLAGFCYGYTSVPGGWWREIVVNNLATSLVDRWFSNAFEFVELAVIREARRQGAGAVMHDALLEGLPHETSVLSTQRGNDAALGLYRSKGWVAIADRFMFPNRPYPYAILGLDL